jgi:dihydroneopterin aldolase
MERTVEQQLEIDLLVRPSMLITDLGDNIEHTLNYDLLREIAIFEAQRKPRNLLETLAQDIMVRVATTCPVCEITVTIRKMVHLDCQSVGIRMTRTVTAEPAD